MVENHQTGALEPRDFAQHQPAVFRMLFHERVFFIGEAGRLVENGVGDSDLADVMQEGGDFDVGQGTTLVQAELPGYMQRPLGETRAVDSSVEILQVKKLIEGADERRAQGQQLFFEFFDT